VDDPFERAAAAIASATALVVTAGAGMGVDSGLPDFRGDEGFWKAYPPYCALGLRFVELANPSWFARDPALAWGFYGHRLDLYRRTRPHAGFDLLRRWAARAADGVFVFTSNVDGQFQRAGFDPARVHECHGALDWLQCTRRCGKAPFPSDPFAPRVDPATFRASPPLPSCPGCGALARPNVLMFGDWGWDSTRYDAQERRLEAFLRRACARPSARVVVVECGAGEAVPTVRRFGESLVAACGATLVRINPREPEGPEGTVSIANGARESLERIDAA
jgi:NAD-dependent SIR2 family protein deacetylase